MLNSTKQQAAIDQLLLDEIGSIVLLQDKKGIKASGKSAGLLRKRSSILAGGELLRGEVIDGSGTFEFQERGRGPYNNGPAIRGGVWGKIYTWLRYRKYGFNWSTKKERIAMAWALTKKIQAKGTYTHIIARPTGVLSDSLRPEFIQSLKEAVLNGQSILEFKDNLMKGFRAK